MNKAIKIPYQLCKKTITAFMADNCPSMAAALAYYTAFSLAPLLVIIIALLGWVVDPQDVKGEIGRQISGVMGPQVASQIQALVDNAHQRPSEGITATVLGLLALLFGATGAFAQLQNALNIAWDVKPDPEENSLKQFFLKRVLSFGLILGIAFLLLVSLVISAVLAAFGDILDRLLSNQVSHYTLQVTDLAFSLTIITLLFAALYRILPDAQVAWRHVWAGACFTALLFTLGKSLIGLYLGQSSIASSFGAAGSFALILVWVYYSSLIVFLGAEFTRAWSEYRGATIQPNKGAVRIITRIETIRPSRAEDSSEL